MLRKSGLPRGWIGAAMITRIDELFAAVFAVELALHLLVEGPRYFKTIGRLYAYDVYIRTYMCVCLYA